MTYYERKAVEIAEFLCLPHPRDDDEMSNLIVMLKEITRDQRHACVEEFAPRALANWAFKQIEPAGADLAQHVAEAINQSIASVINAEIED